MEKCAGWCRLCVYMARNWPADGLNSTACLPQPVSVAAGVNSFKPCSNFISREHSWYHGISSPAHSDTHSYTWNVNFSLKLIRLSEVWATCWCSVQSAFLLSLIVLLSSVPLSLSWTWGHLGRSCSSYCNTQLSHLLLTQRFAAWGSSPPSAAVSCSAFNTSQAVMQYTWRRSPTVSELVHFCIICTHKYSIFCPLKVKCARFFHLFHRLSDTDALGGWLQKLTNQKLVFDKWRVRIILTYSTYRNEGLCNTFQNFIKKKNILIDHWASNFYIMEVHERKVSTKEIRKSLRRVEAGLVDGSDLNFMWHFRLHHCFFKSSSFSFMTSTDFKESAF